MKTLQLLVLFVLAIIGICRAQITDPGWYVAQNASLTPEMVSGATSQSFQANVQLSQLQPSAPVAEAITPQIQALANGLQNNPTNIFNYVHDHIKYVVYFGSKKGAELTLLEKSGNDFDQSALLVALLSAAGYSNNVSYQFGWQEVPYTDSSGSGYDFQHWWQLTLNNTNWTSTENYMGGLLGTRGYPWIYITGDNNTFVIQRVWVALTLGSTTYQLDPAFKVNMPVAALPGFSLTSAMGSSTISNDLVTAATGANTVDTPNYTQYVNEPGVRAKLTAYTTNLLNYLQTYAPNANVQQIVSGWQIKPANDSIDFSNNTRFAVINPKANQTLLSWTYEPTNLMSTFALNFAGTNYQWFMPQLQGQRLSLVYSNNGVAQLWQEDTLLAQGQANLSGGTNAVTFAATHPYGAWDITNNVFIPDPTNFADMTVTNTYQSTNATYAIMYAFEPDWGWLQQRQNKLDTYLQEGFTNGSRQVTSETLNIMGLNWMLQTAQLGQMLAPQLGILPEYAHRFGRMAQEAGHGYYVDVYMQLTGDYPSGGNDTPHVQLENTQFDLWSFFASAMEHGLIEQLQTTNIVGASTVKMLEIANTNGQPIYLINQADWASETNNLSNYGAVALSQIYYRFVLQNYYVLMPGNGANSVASGANSWSGYGYEARQAVNGQATGSFMIIAGGYYGGFAAYPTAIVNPYYTYEFGDYQWDAFTQTPIYTPALPSADPLDTADGTYEVENTDLSLGQAEPRGITLSRYYNGTRRFSNPAGMAGGWIHNYCNTANNIPAPQACLGGTTPAQAASMFAATAAAIALYNGGQPDPKNWLTTALIAKWGIDQLIKSGVSVNLGKDTLQFVQQPNGAFVPPANSSATLTQSGSAYTLQLRHGNRFNFNGSGYLTNIVDQYGRALTVTYNTSNWVNTVTDWTNRTFTFNYTGTPSRLTSVTDGSRTVYYGYATNYNSQGDLTYFTDAEGKTSTYTYDTNHEITAALDALSRLVVSNVYDTQGHVTTQYTDGVTNKTWLIDWSGWQTTEFDPAGDAQNYFYDDQGRLIGQQDALGKLTQTFYDGQNHVVQTVSPLNETNQSIYDGNNNLVQTIDPLGFTNQFIYDGNNNLVKTVDPDSNQTTFGYNSQFSPTGQTNGAGDYVNLAYNTDGTLHTRTDSGGTTTFGYDVYGQLSSIVFPGNLGTNNLVNTKIGDVATNTDARGFATIFQYNNRRQLTNSIAPTNLVTSVAYDSVGNAVGTTDPRGNVSSQIWSVTRHLLATIQPALPQGTPIVTNVYDNRDWLTATLDPLANPTLYTNDPDGRLISLTDPAQRTTTLAYDADGRKLASINAANETNSQTWDARGSLTQTTDGAGHTIVRAYDAAGNQIILTNRNSNKWQFHFDAANRLTETITPLGYSNTVVFNHQGLPASITDQAGNPTSLYYDAKGRLTNRTDLVATTLYGYDANDNQTSVAENGNTNTWTYDAYNRVSSYKDIDGNLIQYRYDASGNLTNLIYPGGRNVYYAFDSNNHLTNVTDWAGRKSSVTYDLDGHVRTITRPNGTYRTIAYDTAGEATNILEQNVEGFPIALFSYNWNKAAEAQWEFAAPLPHTNTLPTRSMTYDADNRLHSVDSNNVTMDADGNLLSGPLTNDTFAAYSYDARNRLQNVGGVTNFYDAINNRIAQNYGTNSTVFVVNPNSKLPQVLMRTKNGVTTYYVYGPGLLYQVTETAASTNMLTYHFDYRGSTVALTDTNGNVTDRMEYSLYATMTYHAGTNDTPFLFNGRFGVMTDPNGLLYMRTRYYNPFLCRFINADPSGFSGGLNFYAYANGNPVSYLDPFGLDAFKEDAFNSASAGTLDNSVPNIVMSIAPNVNTGPQMGPPGFIPAAPYYDPSQPSTMSIYSPADEAFQQNLQFGLQMAGAAGQVAFFAGVGMLTDGLGDLSFAAEETPAVFENAPSGFSNGNLAQEAHNNFESALNDLHGTQAGDWEMRTAPGQTGVDATYVGPASRNPGFNFGELKPYSGNSLGTFGNQLGNWGLPEGQTELFFYNKGGVIGSSDSDFRNCMEYISPWPLLRGGQGEREEGLRLVQQAYIDEPSPSHAREFGIALVWLGKYAEAWTHFRSVIETSKTAGDGDYGMAGVAKWCLDKPDEAVLEWRAGLKANYARASGLGVRMPLLLFFAAVRQPKFFDRKLAEKLLQETTLDKRIKNWPGPIARLVLDQISEAEFENYCRGIMPGDTGINPFARHGPQEASNCLWLAEFYKSVLLLQQRELSEFQNSMRKLTDTCQPEWQDEKSVFTVRIWCEEFFLARYEAITQGGGRL